MRGPWGERPVARPSRESRVACLPPAPPPPLPACSGLVDFQNSVLGHADRFEQIQAQLDAGGWVGGCSQGGRGAAGTLGAAGRSAAATARCPVLASQPRPLSTAATPPCPGENVVLLANHQSEADPAVFALLLEKTLPKLAESACGRGGGGAAACWPAGGAARRCLPSSQAPLLAGALLATPVSSRPAHLCATGPPLPCPALPCPAPAGVIYVAGDRVVTDALCKPFSMGRNLFCVHSKARLRTPAGLWGGTGGPWLVAALRSRKHRLPGGPAPQSTGTLSLAPPSPLPTHAPPPPAPTLPATEAH